MAYIRANDPDLGKYRLLTANPDGSDEKVLRVAPTPTPDQFSWSPDRARIAYVVGRKEMRGAVRTYEIAGGDDWPVKSFDDKIATDIAWMPDGRGMLINYSDERTGFTRPQLGYVSYPGGEFHAITNDTHGYFGMQLSADAKSVVAIQREKSESVVMLPSTGMGTPAPVGGIPNQAEINGLNWDGKGNLIVALRTSIVRIATGGTQMTTIMSDPNAAINDATFCSPDGPILVSWLYREGHAAQNIWRLDADGTHPKQLTSGKEDRLPLCSPDRKWVYYFDFNALNIKRVPFDGGTAETVPGSVVKDGFIHETGVNFSPDGKWLVSVATTVDPKTHVPWHPVALVDVESKNQSSTWLLTGHENVSFPAGFTPDGKAVVYRIIENGAENIWMQPLDGSAGHQLTDFTNDHIKFFEWSPDGRTLAVIRVHTEANVVLLRDAGAAGR
jgi:Tol biopolymer transport system component